MNLAFGESAMSGSTCFASEKVFTEYQAVNGKMVPVTALTTPNIHMGTVIIRTESCLILRQLG